MHSTFSFYSDWLLANIKKRHVSFYEDNARPGRLLPTTLGATRRTCAPLDIVGLPKYDQLSKEERQICSEIRVVPQVYLQIKQIMVQECLKQDGLRLADIRPLVKIDVNKTRKLFDTISFKSGIKRRKKVTKVIDLKRLQAEFTRTVDIARVRRYDVSGTLLSYEIPLFY